MEIWQGIAFQQKDKSKKRKSIAASKAEENTAQNINIENETKEERETSNSKQSSTYLKGIDLKEYGIETESEATPPNLEKIVQLFFIEKN